MWTGTAVRELHILCHACLVQSRANEIAEAPQDEMHRPGIVRSAFVVVRRLHDPHVRPRDIVELNL